VVLDRDYSIDHYATFNRMYPVLKALLKALTQDDNELYGCVLRSMGKTQGVNLPKSI
jgi:hypothetical protein